MSHSQFTAALTGSYIISPSTLYSVAQLSHGGTSFHVPVHEDWVTIGVVGTSSGVQQTKRSQEASIEEKTHHKNKHNSEQQVKKFCSFSVIDMENSQKGNSYVKLVLFSADSSEKDHDGEMLYKGGSGGAYEKFWKLRQGTVVALLNPDILRPQQARKSNILGLTVVNADSIIVIGHSKDYGLCEALLKTGDRCKSWIDKRRGKVCDFHLQAGIERARNSRPEFSSRWVTSLNYSVPNSA